MVDGRIPKDGVLEQQPSIPIRHVPFGVEASVEPVPDGVVPIVRGGLVIVSSLEAGESASDNE